MVGVLICSFIVALLRHWNNDPFTFFFFGFALWHFRFFAPFFKPCFRSGRSPLSGTLVLYLRITYLLPFIYDISILPVNSDLNDPH